jgi:hypothetical protein
MTILALCLSIMLLPVAALHLLWALGYWFPIREEGRLVRTVVGMRGAERMPGPIPCALVVVGLVTVIAAIWWPGGRLRDILLALAGGVFILRGLAAWTPFWRRITPDEPFATLDRRYYGPFSLTVGLGLAILQVGEAA